MNFSKKFSKGKRKGMVLSNVFTIKNLKGLAQDCGYDVDFKVIAIEHNLKEEDIPENRNKKTSRLRSAKEIKDDIEMKRMLDERYLKGEIDFKWVRVSPIDHIFQRQETVEKLADMVIAELENNKLTLEEKLVLKSIKQKRNQQPENQRT